MAGSLLTQLIIERSATLRLDRGARPGAVVSPYCCGWEVAMQLLLELDHFDLDQSHRTCQWNGLQVGWEVDRRSGSSLTPLRTGSGEAIA